MAKQTGQIQLPEHQALMDEAKKAAQLAYAPYSKFYVGAAILCHDGSVITGGNVENASYGLTICAERSAIVRAVAQGKRRQDFKAIAIWAESARNGNQEAIPGLTPCGACRQVLSEFLKPDALILCPDDAAASFQSFQIADLLPHCFGLKQ